MSVPKIPVRCRHLLPRLPCNRIAKNCEGYPMRKPAVLLLTVVALLLAQVTLLAESPVPNPKDPLYQAKGTLHRSYYFKEADDHVVYRLYVPSKWTPTSQMPLLVWINPTLDVN